MTISVISPTLGDNAFPYEISQKFAELMEFLSRTFIGADVTIFNPDLYPDGKYAIFIVKIISVGLMYLVAMHV